MSLIPRSRVRLRRTTIYTHAFRGLKWAALVFVVGTVAMVALLSVSFLASFLSVLVMLGALLWFVDNARKLGRAGLEQMTSAARTAGLKDAVGGTGAKLRDRFNRQGERRHLAVAGCSL